MTIEDELVSLTALQVVDLLTSGAISPLDCLDALEARIARVDRHVNALPTLCVERARDAAIVLMQKPIAERGLLAGLPVAIKDLIDVAGVKTTYGSPIFSENVAATSDPLVGRLELEGALIYAKSNTPEFGAGANTFNDVFGPTLNPWNTARSAAGSSGGAAAALASGTAWLAHGSDTGGSLRNPASFCGVVGMRPSPGAVATKPGGQIDRLLPVQGPMARTVEDCAFFLDALSGEDGLDPISRPKPATSYLASARSGWKPARVAFSADFGITPVDKEIADICRAAAYRFGETGAIVEDAHPDFSGVHDTFSVLRAKSFAISRGPLLAQHRAQMKPEVVWNIEEGLALTMADHQRAETNRAALYARAYRFFDDYDLLCAPTTVVPPFLIGERYPSACNGIAFDSYFHWLAIAYAITVVGCPSVSIPCGLTRDGLPVGLQIIARQRADGRAFAGAKALEDVLGLRGITPILPRAGD
jgi:amidase